ncbi:MAG TPA: hypothetical protein VLU98_03070 [Methanomicrobiales archaeon]|nr:hypothetical protein [Methanomicrobiales archaeon]
MSGNQMIKPVKKVKKKDKPGGRPPTKGAEPGVELEEFICCIREEIRAMVGGHYYFIQVEEECATLCRVPLSAPGRARHEVMDHVQHGISDDDLLHALRILGAHCSQPGYYRISGHIEGKLRALLDA